MWKLESFLLNLSKIIFIKIQNYFMEKMKKRRSWVLDIHVQVSLFKTKIKKLPFTLSEILLYDPHLICDLTVYQIQWFKDRLLSVVGMLYMFFHPKSCMCTKKNFHRWRRKVTTNWHKLIRNSPPSTALAASSFQEGQRFLWGINFGCGIKTGLGAKNADS